MKVCDITQFWSPVSGGVRRYISEKARNLHARGDRHVLVIPGIRDEVSGDEDARVYTIASPLLSRVTGYRVLLRLSEIRRILLAEKPDILESGDPYQVGWRVACESARLGIPAVAFYHSHFVESELRPLGERLWAFIGQWVSRLGARYTRVLYNRFARTLVPSSELAGVLKQWGVKNTVPMDLGVDTRRFFTVGDAKNVIRRRLGLPENMRLLLSVGRLATEKGTRELCEAFEILSTTWPGKYHLVVCGEGLQIERVRSLIRDEREVTWLPFIHEPGVLSDYYRAADLFVHPGIHETFGLVTLEAQACGLPVVGFLGTRMDRIVCHTQAFWAREHTSASLAHSVNAAFDEDLSFLGKMAAQEVAARFSWEGVFARQFDVYEEVIRESRAR